jgi:tRNA (guanine37-N1)-methyltransferase
MRFDVLTIFPDAVVPYTRASILGKAQREGLVHIAAHDLRQYSRERHKKVDDTPYGGGAGMVMTVQPFDAAVRALRLRKRWYQAVAPTTRVVLTSASGTRFTQRDAERLAAYDQVIFLCGRYEGIDARVQEAIADEALSIGDYVLTGGELPALVMMDAIARNVPGVLGNEATLADESHGLDGALEYPQYTKPALYHFLADPDGKTKNSRDLPVPAALLSGDHKSIAAYRHGQRPAAPR